MADQALSTNVSMDSMLATITPEIAAGMIYKNHGKWALSKVGAEWACREMAKRREIIRIVDMPSIQPDPTDQSGEHLFVVVKAARFAVDEGTGREVQLDSAIGSSRAWIKCEVNGEKEGEKIVQLDDKWFEKAIGKAQRSAKVALLPRAFVVKAIEVAAGGGRKVEAAAKEAAAAAKKEREAAKTEKKAADASTGKQGATAQPDASKKDAGEEKAGDGDIRPRLHAVMSGVEKDKEKLRDLLFALTKHRKTSELEDKVVLQLTSVFHGVVRGLNKIVDNSDGTKCIVNAKDEGVVFGSRVQIPSQTAGAATGGEKMSVPADADPF